MEMFYNSEWDYPPTPVYDNPYQDIEIGSGLPHLIIRGFPFN